MIDLAWRTAYRIGFRLMRVWWQARRPAHEGALVAVWHGGRLLVVRQTYRPELGLPGGGVRPGEDPREAARRELREELGLDVAAKDLVLAHEETAYWDGRDDHVRVFAVILQAPPRLRPDRREVEEAWFAAPEEVPGVGLSPFLRGYLSRGTILPESKSKAGAVPCADARSGLQWPG